MKTNILKIIGFTLLSTTAFSQNRESNSVGINVEAPQATLDVKGNVKVKTIEPYKTTNINLVRDNESKRILGFKDVKAYNTLRLLIKPPRKSDWVADLDTKIPIEDFTLIVLNANFLYEEYENKKGENTYKGPNSDDLANKYLYGLGDVENDSRKDAKRKERKLTAYKRVVLEKDMSSKTWHLKADFNAANPYAFKGTTVDSNPQFIWDVYIMAIHNSLINDYTGIADFETKVNNSYEARISDPKLGKILNGEAPEKL